MKAYTIRQREIDPSLGFTLPLEATHESQPREDLAGLYPAALARAGSTAPDECRDGAGQDPSVFRGPVLPDPELHLSGDRPVKFNMRTSLNILGTLLGLAALTLLILGGF